MTTTDRSALVAETNSPIARLACTLLASLVLWALMINTASASGRRQAPTLAEALIDFSGGGELDHNPFDYDIVIQAVIALEQLGGDDDLGGATLLGVLSDPQARVTVFVPRDRALRRLARVVGWDGHGGDAGALTALTNQFDLETIRNVIKYHVVPGRLGVFRVLFTRTFETTLPGATFTRRFLRLVDNDPDIRDPVITTPVQILGGRSIAHTINRILLPVDL